MRMHRLAPAIFGARHVPALILAVASVLSSPKAIAAQSVTLDDIRQLPAVPWLGVSPPGEALAYLLTTPGASGTSRDLWLASGASGESQRLTENVAIQSVVGWNTRGTLLAFIALEGDRSAIWTVAPGSRPRTACALSSGARSAVWLADDTRIAFAARASNGDAPPGESIFVCDLRSGAVTRVTSHSYFGLDFAWSPSGDRVAISRQDSPGFYEGLESDLVLLDVRSGNETTLVARPGVDRSPVWSPDGSQVAFVSGFGRSGLLPNLGIAVVRPGEAPRDIGRQHDRGGYFEGTTLHGWSGDGREIYYSVVDGAELPLFRLSADGAPATRIPLPPGGRDYTYQYTLSTDGHTIAYKASTLSEPAEVYLSRSPHRAARRITRLHEGRVLAGIPRGERIRWTAQDGDTIEGVLLRPTNGGPGPHPLITVLHGGPASAYSLGFPGLAFFNPYQDQLLAARGYAVFLPNPRGSGGYGERFRSAVRRDWGVTPAADVHAGIDYLIARGIADSTRLGLLGWSYGGYLGAWMLAHSNRFAVASVGAGVYDLTSHYGQAAPQLEEYFGGPPWRLPALYREQSPIYHVARIRTPTLLFHGEADNAVSIAQSELLAAALRAVGTPVDFVRYPGEGHSLRQARTQDESFERLQAWIQRWIDAGAPVPSPGLGAGRDAAAPAPSDDVSSLDGIIRAYYDVISGAAGTTPDRVRDAALHHPDALVAITGARRDGERWIRTMTLDEYHEMFGGTRTTAFHEREISRQEQRFGNIAHVWSTYESSREPGGQPFARGINSIQLYRDSSRWWITSWIFDSERRGNPIPAEYLRRAVGASSTPPSP